MYHIVNLTQKRIESSHEERPRANYVLTDSYAPDPINKYTVMDEEELNEWQINDLLETE